MDRIRSDKGSGEDAKMENLRGMGFVGCAAEVWKLSSHMTSIDPRDLKILSRLRPFFLLVDLGFLAYWAVTALHAIPDSYLYKDYDDPMAVAWNWSFMPLDLLVSATGLWSLFLLRRNRPEAARVAIVSLSLTSATGFQAISFWAVRGDFDLVWWTPNLFLLVYPWWFLGDLLRMRPMPETAHKHETPGVLWTPRVSSGDTRT